VPTVPARSPGAILRSPLGLGCPALAVVDTHPPTLVRWYQADADADRRPRLGIGYRSRITPRVALGTDKELGMAKSGSTGSRTPSELIDERIEELGDWRGTMLSRLRAMVKKADPDIVEEWKWRGVPTWYHDGIVCTGETYKDHVKITFAKGASIEDPSGLFNSSLDGNVRRAIDFHEGDKVDEKALKALIRAAIDLNESKAKR
jgi:hypothetical protein